MSKHFCSVSHISSSQGAFTKVVKMWNHTELWDADLAWYSPTATHWICINVLEHGFEIQTLADRSASCSASEIS